MPEFSIGFTSEAWRRGVFWRILVQPAHGRTAPQWRASETPASARKSACDSGCRFGEIVTRQELFEQVWGTDTFVDFEHGLNFAIRQIRSVLNENADLPQYLETIPKRGYRFIASVTPDVYAATPPIPEPEPKRATNWKTAVVFFVALLVLGGVAYTWYWRETHLRVQRAPIVLGEFANRTGDSVFDGTLREGLSIQLEQSPFLQFVSDEQINETLRLMARPKNTLLTPDVAREVCQRVNGTVAFAGSIRLIGNRYSLILRATECATGKTLASTEAEASDKSHVLDAVSKLASEMRRKLGEPLSSVRQYDVPLASVTTPSIEALRCYTEGMQSLSRDFDYSASLSWFQKAIELDPEFAMAHWAIGDVYAILGETNAAVDFTRKAFQLRERVSVREKSLIEANYYYYVLGDVEKARQSCEFLSKLYAFNPDSHNSVAVFAETVGQYDVGLAEYQIALRLSPRSSYLYRDVAYTYLALDRIANASDTLQKAHTMNLDFNMEAIRYSIAFYRDDRSEMSKQVASAAGRPEVENLLLEMEADSAAYIGELSRAREETRRAIESAEREGKKETSALYYAASAVREALLGNAHEAEQLAVSASKYSSGRDVAYGVALAFLYAGDVKAGQAMTEEVENRFTEDTVVKCNYLPALKAKIALLHNNPEKAVEVLTAAKPCELGLPVYSYYNWPNLYPAYIRGEAYLAAHKGAEAVAEFRKVISHRGIVLNEPIGALAHLQLGRAYMMSGQKVAARNAFQAFLTLWKDADPNLPLLARARTELAGISQ